LGGGVDPKVLPMVPVKNRDGSECVEGMNLLRRMVMSRAFPDVLPEEYITLITQVFDGSETLDRLCRVSGGHLRNLMGMLFGCLQQDDPPRVFEYVDSQGNWFALNPLLMETDKFKLWQQQNS
jgi:hypothetical protein